MMAAALQSDTIWLRTSGYNVEALNSKLTGRIPELQSALTKGLPACPDTNRKGFYDVELPGGWAYIHVREDAATVYLSACALRAARAPRPRRQPAFLLRYCRIVITIPA
jgi:hypothetical protein